MEGGKVKIKPKNSSSFADMDHLSRYNYKESFCQTGIFVKQ